MRLSPGAIIAVEGELITKHRAKAEVESRRARTAGEFLAAKRRAAEGPPQAERDAAIAAAELQVAENVRKNHVGAKRGMPVFVAADGSEVHAVKIATVSAEGLMPAGRKYALLPVMSKWIEDNEAQPGGWYVVPANGVAKFIPDAEFVAAYTKRSP